MGHTYQQIYMHIIWGTKDREPLLYGDLEKFVHRRIREIALSHKLQPLAINSAWDHTHLLMKWNTTTSFAGAVGEWKSRTHVEWRKKIKDSEDAPYLHWQDGFRIFSIWKSDVDRLKRYIFNQKRHHRDRSTIYRFEMR